MISVSDSGRIIIDDEESNFIIQEFVPKTIYDQYGNKSIWFVRGGIFRLAQFYRDFFDTSVYVNNWHLGGEFNLRGYRSPQVGIIKELGRYLNYTAIEKVKEALSHYPFIDDEKMRIGSWLSQHKAGNAFDCTVKGLTANETRQKILDNEQDFLDAGLTTLESERFAPSWVHSDRRVTLNPNNILIVGA